MAITKLDRKEDIMKLIFSFYEGARHTTAEANPVPSECWSIEGGTLKPLNQCGCYSMLVLSGSVQRFDRPTGLATSASRSWVRTSTSVHRASTSSSSSLSSLIFENEGLSDMDERISGDGQGTV